MECVFGRERIRCAIRTADELKLFIKDEFISIKLNVVLSGPIKIPATTNMVLFSSFPNKRFYPVRSKENDKTCNRFIEI